MQMRAVWYNGAGGPDVIEFRDVTLPEPGPQEIRVRVHAAGLNRADLLQRMGRYPAPPGWPSRSPASSTPAPSSCADLVRALADR
jgi:NADPH:quinone reductase-like Zn-dependent oxidoreductase